jgi:CheY-like chemotaxis protein
MDERPPGWRGHVLVVDDEPAILEACSMLLELEGFRITVAPDGAAALARIRELGAPDVVLTDLMMPRLDGLGLARAIRAADDLEDVRVVVTSAALVDTAPILEVADAFVTKDGKFETLLATIDTQLASRRT